MSDLKIVVVEASETDLDAIASFFWEAWREAGPDAPGWAGASEDVMEEITTRESILKHMGSADRGIFLAKEGDRVV
ncbi:MAG: hypothetical protein LN412_07075, partial [Candidatus Thermoplasmatota archaeon]|nr:hypothetical protein [Candidatus Thermoplasmatota archaeon]